MREKKYVNRNRTSSREAAEVQRQGSSVLSTNEWKSVEVSEGAGSVRVSISIGHSEDYGRNKFSVTVDHGLSCGQSSAEKEEAFNEARLFCLNHVESLREEVIKELFKKGSGGTK